LDSLFEMKIFLAAFVFSAFAAVLSSCETNLKSAPPVTAALAHGKADESTLTEGRKVFLNRCIGCHALPDLARYDSARIPRIVGWMSHRAHLTPEQHDALVKYLLAVNRSSSRD
jgi:mono/diheme cytochrome c family protein